MGEIVSTAVERARRRAPTVEFDVTIRPWTVFGDARALERAVLNLLDNAGKWSPPGGTVTVRLTDGVITVTDQGPGISEADLPFVFDRFYRAEESRNMPGSGLGLAIVRQAAERHGGSVTAERAPGGGALLKLRLPHSSSVTHTEL
jgi:two-component system sensor histidine kinase MprB